MKTNLVKSTKSSSETMEEDLLGTTLSGYALINIDGVKKISKRDIHYKQSITPEPPYLGFPITRSVAEVLKSNFISNPIPNLNQLEIGSDYGRNELMAILNQPNCERIRFYLAKRYNVDFEVPTDFQDGITLVALGLDKDGVEIASDVELFKNNIGVKQRLINAPIDTIPVEQNGLIFEMVPPVRGGIKFLKSDTIEKIVLRFLKIDHF